MVTQSSVMDLMYQVLISQWGAALLIFLILTSLGWAVRRLLQSWIHPSSSHPWWQGGLEAFTPPSFWLFFGLGLFFAAEILCTLEPLAPYGEGVVSWREVFLVVMASWILFRLKDQFEKILLHRLGEKGAGKSEQALVTAYTKLMSLAVFVIAGFAILEVLHVPIGGLLAFGGVSGIAISWAAKDVVANFFGGLMIHVNRPFTHGDWIRSPNKNFEGVVEHIGWYMTQIRTFSRRPMYIPNALITDAIIENPGRMYNRQIKFDLGIRYEDMAVCEVIRQEVESMLRSHEQIDQTQLLMVHFLEFGPFSLKINIYCFAKTTHWGTYRNVHQDVLLKVAAIVERHGAAIAFPTQTVIVEGSSPSAP